MLPETSILAYVVDSDDPHIENNRNHPSINVVVLYSFDITQDQAEVGEVTH